jgi:predicted metal-dependent HD superfamily phosphohydrolase
MIYNVLNSDNEERSAKLAVARLNELGLPDSKIRKCEQYIIATKSHEASDDTDMNLFTDADLAILGSQPQQYLQYIEQIRQEYKYFPDIVYKPGRKKVLHHFLNMQTIYKTKEFAAKYEQQARANLSMEIEMLQ